MEQINGLYCTSRDGVVSIEKRTISGNLKEFQSLVGGSFEMMTISPELVLLMNEDGQLLQMVPTGIVRIPNGGDGRLEAVAGDFFICRKGGTHFESLNDLDFKRIENVTRILPDAFMFEGASMPGCVIDLIALNS